MALNNRGGFLPGIRRSRLGVVALVLGAMLATMPGSVAARSGGLETINVAWTPAGFTFAASGAFADSGVVNVTQFGCPQVIPQTPLANCVIGGTFVGAGGSFTLATPMMREWPIGDGTQLRLQGSWVITGGTGNYATLRGAGTLTGECHFIFDVGQLTESGEVTFG